MGKVAEIVGVSLFIHTREEHFLPHVHARFGGHEASIAIQTGEILAGSIHPSNRRALLSEMERKIVRKRLMDEWRSIHPGTRQ